MGLEPATLAMVVAGGSSAVNTLGNIHQNRGQQRRADRLESRAMGMMETGPSFLESMLRSQFNTGQDGQMQMMRSMPGASTLNELSETGNPFDTSELFEALQPLRGRQLQEGLGALRAGAPGLGQRFGSAMRRNEGQTVLEHLQNISAQDAGIQMQSHEAAQGRRLGAAQIQQGSAQGLMQILMQAENSRRQGNIGLLGTAVGVPQAGGVQYGQPGMDIAQLMLLQQLVPGGQSQPGGFQPTRPQPWQPPTWRN